MADKSSFTKEEWTLLLESPMMAGMAITAADPSGLWGLLKESFAGGNALAKALSDTGANPLVKALATDFSTSEARSAARDGLKAKFANSQPADVKTKSIEALRQVSAVLEAKAPGDAAAFKTGCARSAKPPLKRPARVAACLALAAFRLVRLRKRPWPKFPAPSGFDRADKHNTAVAGSTQALRTADSIRPEDRAAARC